MKALLSILVVFVGSNLVADKGDGVCRLVVHELLESGTKKVSVELTQAASHEHCKLLASARKTASISKDEVTKVNVVFAFRGPALLPPVESTSPSLEIER